jgi:hypothetical protein
MVYPRYALLKSDYYSVVFRIRHYDQLANFGAKTMYMDISGVTNIFEIKKSYKQNFL